MSVMNFLLKAYWSPKLSSCFLQHEDELFLALVGLQGLDSFLGFFAV